MYYRKGDLGLGLRKLAFVFAASIILYSAKSYAVEGGAGVYLLGQRSNHAAVMPPPGLFFQFEEFLYSGDIADSKAIAENGRLDLGIEADIALSMATGIWAPAAEFLGGRPMLTLTLPFGYQKVTADAQLSLGGAALRGRFTDDVFTVGDPVAGASLGWNKDNWHWTVFGALNVPIGDYDGRRSANFAFNRWAQDTTGAVTYLDPATGMEASLAAGVTFNGENIDTDYDSGTEFHLEVGVSKTFQNGLMLGLAGYYYNQLTDDEGTGVPSDGFQGRVFAIGPALAYTLNVKGIPIVLKARYYHEFNANNRLEGDAVFIGFTMPLAVFE
ncbi:MAG: transporter [Proteobacteria bacterium]|nr:transporter [Pseudomonadota bacterium]